jgi:hypothetical protein
MSRQSFYVSIAKKDPSGEVERAGGYLQLNGESDPSGVIRNTVFSYRPDAYDYGITPVSNSAYRHAIARQAIGDKVLTMMMQFEALQEAS